MLLAWLLVSSQTARAECSHYVVSRSDGAVMSAGLDLLVQNGLLPAHAQSPKKRSERPFPCSGALCSGAPATPSVPIVVMTPTGSQWACLDSPIPITDPGSSAAPGRDPLLLLVDAPLSIFHPPRPASGRSAS
jgi:hypothetical protein